MKRKLLSITITALLAAMAGYSANVVAAKGTPGPPNGGGEDPTAVNHLSYPALKMNGESLATYFFNVGAASAGSLGTTYSYGCDKVEVVDVSGTKFTYPNTSCVSGWKEDGSAVAFLTPDECTLDDNNPLTPHPCLGHTVDRIYWQKIDGNTWSADAAVPNNAAGSAPVVVRYLDWGDSIESVTWKDTSVLRVETQVYADLSQDSRASDVPSGTQRGLQMWHSQGHGINEQWGVRASVGTENVTPWVYAAPVAIVNAGTASLYLSKLFPQTDTQMGGCPVAGGDIPPDYPDDYPWTTTFGWTGSGWTSSSKDPCDLPVVPYTVELSVTGKFVHGYNWRMRDMDAALAKACPTFAKSGWWRLTFVPNDVGGRKVTFTTPDGEPIVIGPPELPPATTTIAAVAEEEETDESLYTPAVDTTNQISFIDICISSSTKGGGGGGKGGGGGPRR